MMWRNIAGFSKAAAAARTHGSRRCMSTAIPGPCIVLKRGADILHDPWFNKDTGFPLTERDRLGLRGLLPPRVISFEQQYDRFIESFRSLERNTQGQPENVVSLAKWRILNRLHDRNETLSPLYTLPLWDLFVRTLRVCIEDREECTSVPKTRER